MFLTIGKRYNDLMWSFTEVWVDMSFPTGHVERLDNGGIVLSVQDWINLMTRIHAADSEIQPHLRETHLIENQNNGCVV